MWIPSILVSAVLVLNDPETGLPLAIMAAGRLTVAGRRVAADTVDVAAGVRGLLKVGERVCRGQPLVLLGGADDARVGAARACLAGAFEVGAAPEGAAAPLVLAEIP